jgi:hypothetical protein
MSAEQRAIIGYLRKRHAEGMEVIPSHWLMIDLYGVSGVKRFTSGQHNVYEQNASVKASLFRTLRRLREKGMIVERVGVTNTYYQEPGYPTEYSEGGTKTDRALGYALAEGV